MSKPVVRLHLFFATENDTAVILRQGPMKQFRLILWHRDTDTFEDGQWLKHKVYLDWCDLSPDGRHFIYFMLDAKWSSDTEGAYTVISRPPYFTAIALFPEGDTWAGGGRFLDNANYVAVGGSDIIGRDEGLTRLFRREPTKDCPTGLFQADGRCARIDKAKAATLDNFEPPSWTHALDRYDTLGGKLYRRAGNELELIRDFNDMAFEEILAPYDWRDASGGENSAKPWHPLAGEDT